MVSYYMKNNILPMRLFRCFIKYLTTVTYFFPTDKSVDIEFKICYIDRVADLFKSWSFIDVSNIVDKKETIHH